MKYQFTRYGLINAAWSLIPIFPLWSLFPGMGLEIGIEKLLNDCELSYKIVLYILILLVIIATTLYLVFIRKIIIKGSKFAKTNFRLFSLLIYTFINTVALIIILGPHVACNGSSMSIMVVIFSGPIASLR